MLSFYGTQQDEVFVLCAQLYTGGWKGEICCLDMNEDIKK